MPYLSVRYVGERYTLLFILNQSSYFKSKLVFNEHIEENV